MAQFIFLVLGLICLTSCCNRCSLSLCQTKVDERYLASFQARTPDPRTAHPPIGQRLIMQWHVPASLLKKKPQIVLHLIFWNSTEEVRTYPIKHCMGSKVYFLLNKDFEEKEGLLTYKAEIVTADGEVIKEWKHQLWVKLIRVEDLELNFPPHPEPQPEAPLDRLDEIEESETDDDEEFIPWKPSEAN